MTICLIHTTESITFHYLHTLIRQYTVQQGTNTPRRFSLKRNKMDTLVDSKEGVGTKRGQFLKK